MKTIKDKKGHKLSVGDKVIAKFKDETEVAVITDIGRSIITVERKGKGGTPRIAKLPARTVTKLSVNKPVEVPERVADGSLSVGDRVIIRGYPKAEKDYEGCKGVIQTFYQKGKTSAFVLILAEENNKPRSICTGIPVHSLKKLVRKEKHKNPTKH